MIIINVLVLNGSSTGGRKSYNTIDKLSEHAVIYYITAFFSLSQLPSCHYLGL